MKLPFAARARVERNKIVEYLLSVSHPDGRSKARFFARFGFSLGKWRAYERALKKHGRSHDVSTSVESQHGARYSIDGTLETRMGGTPRYGLSSRMLKNSPFTLRQAQGERGMC